MPEKNNWKEVKVVGFLAEIKKFAGNKLLEDVHIPANKGNGVRG